MRARPTQAAILLLLLPGCAGPGLPRFEAALAQRDSATAVLEHWCAANRLADPPRIVADGMMAASAPEPADARPLLQASAETALGYRHVALSCGGAVLSVAHNWYVPDRLTPAMNATLTSTRIPFGKVAAPLGFRRERLDSQRGARPECPRDTILSHRALLRLPDGRPLALLVECYTRANLARGSARRG